jgi:hypothetical protein
LVKIALVAESGVMGRDLPLAGGSLKAITELDEKFS